LTGSYQPELRNMSYKKERIGYKTRREIEIERVINYLRLKNLNPLEALEFICSLPDLFDVSAPVQEGDKFIYTVTVKKS